MQPTHRTRAALLLLLISIAIGLCAAASAAGFTAEEEAEFKDNLMESCCSGDVMESGAVEQESVRYSNEGSVTWGAPGAPIIELGTEGQGEASISNFGEQLPNSFEMPSWPRGERPVVGVTREISHGLNYLFTWDVKAPTVGAEESYLTSWALVADGRHTPNNMSGWMDKDSGLGVNALLSFTVKPWRPPSLTASGPSEGIAAGQQFSVEATGEAVASLNHITFEYDGHTIESVRPRNPAIAYGQQAVYSTSATFTLIGGARTVVVTAYDDSGRPSTPAVVAVPEPPVEPPPHKSSETPETHKPDATPKTVAAPILAHFFPGDGSTRTALVIKSMVVTGLRQGESVEVVCRDCHDGAKFGPITAHGRELNVPVHHLKVTRHSTVIIYVTKAGMYGREQSYSFKPAEMKVRHGNEHCLALASLTQVACKQG